MTDPTDDRAAPDDRAASDDRAAPDDRAASDDRPAPNDHPAPDGPASAATDGGSDPTDTGGSTPDEATDEFAPAADGAAVEPETDHRDAGGLSGLFSRDLLVKTVVGFAIALAFLYVLGMQAGWSEILATLAGVEPVWIVAGCLSTAVCLALWGKAWQVVLSVVGVEESYRRLVVTFYAATFANYVTPLGQAGGEPFIAYVLSRDTEASYQDSLASVVTADLLNLLPFFNFAAIGLGWLLLQAGLTEDAENLAWGLVLMALGVPLLVYVGWRHRDGVEAAVLRLVAPVAGRTDRVGVDGVRRRIDEFYVAIERIADSPRKLLYALAFSYAGWVFFALPLYFSGLALGLGGQTTLLLVFFIVPASTLAGLVPTPGGSGAVEATLAVLLIALTGLGAADAGSVAIVYRVVSYYFAIAAGGVAAAWVVKRS